MTDYSQRVPDNLTQAFFDHAAKNPNQTALIEPLSWSPDGSIEEKSWTYGQFSQRIQAHQLLLDRAGLRAGDRVLILVPVSSDLYALVAACFANGLIPIFIETTIAREQFLRAIRVSAPRAIFSTEALFKFRFFLPLFWTKKLYSMESAGIFLTHWNPDAVEGVSFRTLANCESKNTGLITFTTGSTGQPKAADRRLDILYHQREISRSLWTDGSLDDVEITAFPLVVLNNLVHGVTTVIAPLEAHRLDSLPVKCWLQQIRKHRVTRLVAPPSVMHQLTRDPQHREVFSGIQRTVSGGAPVPKWLMQRIQNMFSSAENQLVYGSTEAEPIANIPISEALLESDEGYLVGKPISYIGVQIQENGSSGEVLVSGPHVVEKYLFGSEADRRLKVTGSGGKIWHRTGDSGALDSAGRIRLLGRLSDRVAGKDIYALEHQMENRLEKRTAVIADAKGEPVLFVQSSDSGDAKRIANTAQELGYRGKLELIPKIPLDRRHFWKVDRTTLKKSLSKQYRRF